MVWRENRPIFGRKARRHSKAAKKGHRKKRIKKKIKSFIIRKTISHVAGLPGADDIIEEAGDKKNRILRDLEKIKRNSFELFLINHDKMNKKLEKVELEIGKIGVIKEIRALRGELEQDKSKVEEYKSKIDETNIRLEKINIEDIKNDPEDEIKERIGAEITILM